MLNSENSPEKLKNSHLFRKDELFQILQNLVQINSENPPGKEEAIARHIQDLLSKNGVAAELQWAGPERPNVIARLKGSMPGPTIIFNGHLDVVPAGDGWTEAPFSGTIKEGKLYGRGAADMKSGVAVMLYAVIVLQRLKAAFCGEIILFFDVDEERINLGMKKYIAAEVQADYAIIGEPTGLNIGIGHLGCARFRLKTFGTPGHTAMVRHPDNAIYKMAGLIDVLESLSGKIRQKEDPIIGHASLTVSTIKGGTVINIVPEICEIEIDRRTLPQETREDVFEEIDACVRVIADKSNFAYDLECFQFVPATVIDQENPLVRRLSTVAAGIQGKEILVTSFDATCEAPFLALEKGIPTVIFGPGNLSQAHVIDEYVKLDEVEQAAMILIHLAMDWPPNSDKPG